MMRLTVLKVLTTAIVIVAPLSISVTAQTDVKSPLQILESTSYGSILAPQNFRASGIDLIKGRPIAEGISIGSTKLKDFTPATAIAAAGAKLDLGEVRLFDLKFLNQTPLQSVVNANPSIANLKAEEVGWVEWGDRTLAELAASELGRKPLPASVLQTASIGQFGDIANTPYSKYPEAATQPIANFPGLKEIPLSKLVNIPSTTGTGKVIDRIKVDRVNTRELAAGIERRISSGSNKQPHAPCTASANNCSVLEIRGQSKGVTGSLWMVGQKLTGGSGLVGDIATAAGIREYAGYEIPGTDLKLVAISSDARTGTAQLRLDMRTSSPLGSTPFFIPVLPMAASEKNGNVALPVAVLPVAATMAKPGLGTTLPGHLPSTELTANLPQITPTDSPADNPNLQNGNIGRAVKTNAINPAIEGLQ